MTREEAISRLGKISANYREGAACTYADCASAIGFLDTSQKLDGSRGIVFFKGAAIFNLGGSPTAVRYADMRRVDTIASFEDSFADELQISGSGIDIRVSDISLDKSELKSFIESLREDFLNSYNSRETADSAEELQIDLSESNIDTLTSVGKNALRSPEAPPENTRSDNLTETPVKITADSTEDQFEVKITDTSEPGIPDIVFEDGAPVISETLPEDYTPAPIPTGKIDWLSGGSDSDDTAADSDEPAARERVMTPEIPETSEKNEPTDNSPTADENAREGSANSREAAAEKAPENNAEAAPFFTADEYAERSVENYSAAFAEVSEQIDQQAPAEEQRDGNAASETADEPRGKARDDTDDFPENDAEELLRIGNMTPEETLAFLSESLNEINSIPDYSEEHEKTDEPSSPKARETDEPPLKKLSDYSPPAEEEKTPQGLTVEPIWGDIYIKASRNLRELCESGRITMEQIENELRDKLLDAARAFSEVTANPSKIPKVLIPKITELKAASYNFEQYFRSGEDIAERAMFFMLYQMLSYADRIAETPETKERLNDFFRRFGPAGITLSMLDVRV